MITGNFAALVARGGCAYYARMGEAPNETPKQKYKNGWGLGRLGELALFCFAIAGIAGAYTVYFWLRWGFLPDMGIYRFIDVNVDYRLVEWRGVDMILRGFLDLHVSLPTFLLGILCFWGEFRD